MSSSVMTELDFIILGGGPSGLTLAHALLAHGVPRNRLLLVEKEAVVGGLCRSEMVDGAPLDIGGGHFLDVRNQRVLDFLFRFLPGEEWQQYARISKIRLRGQLIDHPLEANLWQFAKLDQVDYLESIARSGSVRGLPMPARFTEWVRWKFGDRIANEYMLPYNRKIWGGELESLGTAWLHKLPDVSFREVLQSCLENRPFGKLPAHGTFLYPKHSGYGELWRRMGDALGDRVIVGCPVTTVDLVSRVVNGYWSARTIVSTIPWSLWPDFCAVPGKIREAIAGLRKVSIDIDYLPETPASTAHWIYEPDESARHHRQLLRANFCPESRGHWTETNSSRSEGAVSWRHHNEFAYPVNSLEKEACVRKVLQWAASQNIVGLGRWGKWEHMNSDVAVAEAMAMANELTKRVD